MPLSRNIFSSSSSSTFNHLNSTHLDCAVEETIILPGTVQKSFRLAITQGLSVTRHRVLVQRTRGTHHNRFIAQLNVDYGPLLLHLRRLLLILLLLGRTQVRSRGFHLHGHLVTKCIHLLRFFYTSQHPVVEIQVTHCLCHQSLLLLLRYRWLGNGSARRRRKSNETVNNGFLSYATFQSVNLSHRGLRFCFRSSSCCWDAELGLLILILPPPLATLCPFRRIIMIEV